jgi:hypothetical protein
MVIKDMVTRSDLRGMKVGQTEIFILPTVRQLESARAACTQLKMYGMAFTTSIKPEDTAIVITRNK